jgi:hypothetical protein
MSLILENLKKQDISQNFKLERYKVASEDLNLFSIES